MSLLNYFRRYNSVRFPWACAQMFVSLCHLCVYFFFLESFSYIEYIKIHLYSFATSFFYNLLQLCFRGAGTSNCRCRIQERHDAAAALSLSLSLLDSVSTFWMINLFIQNLNTLKLKFQQIDRCNTCQSSCCAPSPRNFSTCCVNH